MYKPNSTPNTNPSPDQTLPDTDMSPKLTL